MCQVVKKSGKTEDIYSAKFGLTFRGQYIEYESLHLLQNTLVSFLTDVEELEQFVFEHIIGKQCCYFYNDTTVTKKEKIYIVPSFLG